MTLWYLLCGRPLYFGETALEKLMGTNSLGTRFSWMTPVPRDRSQIDERIAYNCQPGASGKCSRMGGDETAEASRFRRLDNKARYDDPEP